MARLSAKLVAIIRTRLSDPAGTDRDSPWLLKTHLMSDSHPSPDRTSPVYHVSPPAKLNLFLEILGRRDDGFHELDTVMVAIDWRDELQLRLTREPGISLEVEWLPSREAVADQLGVDLDNALLHVPTDGSNLVHRVLQSITAATGYAGGWSVRLGKRIPSGAGMGGASSDAAATLRLAAVALIQKDARLASQLTSEKLIELAGQLGSDVPFFLGDLRSKSAPSEPADFVTGGPGSLARALGRGEKLTFYDLPAPHRFLVVYPAIALSTAAVYAQASVTVEPRCGLAVVAAVVGATSEDGAACGEFIREPVADAVRNAAQPNRTTDDEILYNALTRPASGLSPAIGEAIQCLRELEQPTQPLGRHRLHCQMTGSGSACFIWLTPDGRPDHDGCRFAGVDEAWLATIRERLPGGALVQTVVTCPAAPEIFIA